MKKEDENVVALLKQLQHDYYNKQTITRKVYLKRIEEYKIRRIEIERSIAVLEAKLAKKEKLEELKAKEAPKKEIISEVKKKEEEFKKQPPVIKPKKRFSFKNLFKGEEKDYSGEVKKVLDGLVKKKEKPTNYSVIMAGPTGDKTIMVYRGASDLFCEKDISWKKIKKSK